MPICETQKIWTSNVTRQGVTIEIATFTIDSIQPNGDFVGTFTIAGGASGEIEGKCAGAALTFVRPRGAPIYRYNGAIVTVGSRIFNVGTRAQIGFSPDDIKELGLESAGASGVTDSEREARELALITWLRTINPLLVGDDWVAEKTGT